eukprot:14037198-Heterocapsa_arctica.AAC.1
MLWHITPRVPGLCYTMLRGLRGFALMVRVGLAFCYIMPEHRSSSSSSSSSGSSSSNWACLAAAR